jgi:hypothetical protein
MRFPKLSALALAATLAFPAFAGSAFNGYAITSTGLNNTFYDTSTATMNLDWTAGLGTIMKGTNLWLGGEVETFPSLANAGVNNYDSVKLAYSIDGGANQNLNLAFNSNPTPTMTYGKL